MKKLFLFIALGVVFSVSAQDRFSFGASYTGDAYYNAAGGLKTGGGFMGMAGITVGLEAWRGGEFFVNGAAIHGKSLTGNYLGDMQVASNIDAGEHTYLHELWFRQALGAVTLTVGLQDLNAEFMVSGGGGEFLNSSFGVPPVIATGIPVPIFPLTGLGVAASWRTGGRVVVRGALFDGNQTAFEHNPHNVHWDFSEQDGVLAIGEVHLDERFKLGAYYHSADDNYGFYGLVDQPLADRLSVFGQLAWAPKAKNDNNFSLGLGANLDLAERHALGLAATHAGLHAAQHKHETAVELFYKFTLNDNISFRPDVQWVVNPSGGPEKLPNAAVGILRLDLEF